MFIFLFVWRSFGCSIRGGGQFYIYQKLLIVFSKVFHEVIILHMYKSNKTRNLDSYKRGTPLYRWNSEVCYLLLKNRKLKWFLIFRIWSEHSVIFQEQSDIFSFWLWNRGTILNFRIFSDLRLFSETTYSNCSNFCIYADYRTRNTSQKPYVFRLYCLLVTKPLF